ncbi:AraC family transcriptional regulator [Lachnospiraceae bacterium OttesenSCG-928-D06]|nr:AraC family transcriptional regulator [Lachnospiraceae bacterium OttesenSCG-928-D06]
MYQAIVIDDEKWVIKSLIATIKHQEYFSITNEFYDGVSGLEYIRTNKPDLAFVDVKLPGMGGLEILQTAHTEGLHTMFVMISGHAEFAYAQKAMFHNAIGYCLKPFSQSELMDSLLKAKLLLDNMAAEKLLSESLLSEGLLPFDQAQDSTMNSNSSTQYTYTPKHLVSSHKSVQKMIDYTEAHYKEDISIQVLADYCSINSNYASQLFKQEMGTTYIRYLTGLRIEHAIWLLLHTDLTVFSIASQVGYSDYFYFAKVFKKITGQTPTSYRSMT